MWYIFFFILEVYLFILRARERVRVEKGQRERGGKNPSRLCAVSAEPNVVLDPMNHEIMT